MSDEFYNIFTVYLFIKIKITISLILTSAASGFCRVTGVTIEEAADLPGLSEDWRSRQEPFPKGGQGGRDRE